MAGTGFNIGLDGHLARPLTERQAEDIAEGLHIIYTRARENMLQAVAKRMERGITRPGWATEKASEVMAAHQQLAVQMEQAARAREGLLSGILERAALTGSQRFYRDMAAVVGAAGQISPNASKVGYILADLNNSLNAAERRILRQFDDAYSDIIAGASAELATGTVTARQAVGKALRSFADNGIDGFTDRAGRHWQMETYAEMATLTAIERASIAGYVDTMQSYGYDLAVIDGHAGSCPVCTAWEGVIISVSGEADGYPSLSDAEAAGCFHPRCLHDIHTYYEGITHEPAGGFRTAPREIQPAGKEYTARSIQRYMERQVRKYKDRQRVAITPQDELQARNMARRWQERLRQHVDAHKDKVLLRHYDREGGRVALSEAAKQLQYDVKSGKIKTWQEMMAEREIMKNSELKNGLPAKGKPNSISDKVDDAGKVLQRRVYGKDGIMKTDYDTTDHNLPHMHPTGAHKHNIDIGLRNPHGKPLPLSEEDLRNNEDIIQRGVNYRDP